VRLLFYLRETLTNSPASTFKRARRLYKRRRQKFIAHWNHHFQSAYSPSRKRAPLRRFQSLLDPNALSITEARSRAAVDLHLQHRFDLLGSGWLDAGFGPESPGLEGRRFDLPTPPRRPGGFDASETRRIDVRMASSVWRLLDPAYAPIDWQRDFRSGFRWSARTPGLQIRYGDRLGVDVKLPWEMGRCHHFLHYAIAYANPETSAARRRALLSDFRNTILDFVATNPPGFGVQWACPMDVAIRIVNWLAAWDIFYAHDALFDDPFERVLADSVHDHALFIAQNIEWNPVLRGNHYLCELVGLVVCGSHLPLGTEQAAHLWHGFAGLLQEIPLQFYENGANFEGSTSYHRLSTESALLGLAYIQRIGGAEIERAFDEGAALARQCPGGEELPREFNAKEDPIPEAILQRIARACTFSRQTTQPNGDIVQIGDNDNGRILKLDPAYEIDGCGAPIENVNNHQHLRSAFHGAGLPSAKEDEKNVWVDGFFFAALLGGALLFDYGHSAEQNRNSRFAPFNRPGLFFFHRRALWLSVRCGENGQNDFGGHAHNDQLSLTACFADAPFFVDCGTYLYTPLPERREQFRATNMHNTVAVEGEAQNRSAPDTLFRLHNDAMAKVICATDTRFEGEHSGFSAPHHRCIEIEDDGFSITDICDARRPAHVFLHLDPNVKATATQDGVMLSNDDVQVLVSVKDKNTAWQIGVGRYSPAYGRFVDTVVLSLPLANGQAEWRARLVSCAAPA
jgi:hypothetical protein